ncbi:Hsp20/alpha crystallin family protein [Clostridium sp. DSM 100503]|uniref:heat shock protein Hsp18 n=1 Tax=Clostridium sp. DSM 100503 TaxID=2963282 RepID=UPI002149CBBD|nr:heat shock protein Hsp18 [Clostridium sp. DSM 100503]MCR1949940.1 Hsp20/alpha crystallin family protein [Clostridium sp. DSM 100503]
MFEMVPWKKNNYVQRKGDDFENMVNNFFNDDFFNSFSIAPFGLVKNNFSVDLKETDNEYIIEADLPGVDKKDIDINYSDGYLTISAKRNSFVEDKKDNYVRQERSYGEFKRSFYVDNIEDDKIDANFDNGVLKINLHKLNKELSNIKKIEVK